jgi:predicted DsbA family dithiol-disulfide isomerase
MAFANPLITAYAVEATEFPDLARRYQVSGVPKTVVNEEVEIMGGLPQDAFVEQALVQFTIDKAEFTKGTRRTEGIEGTDE